MSNAAIRVEYRGAVLEITPEVAISNFIEVYGNRHNVLPPISRNEIPRIGQRWKGQGGILSTFVRGMNGDPDYFIVVPPGDDGYIDKITFGGYGEDEPGATCEFDGWKNTIALYESKIDHPAAQWARACVIEGHRDYHLLSRRESAGAYAGTPELFAKKWHQTSTQYSAHSAWGQYFENGDQDYFVKYDEFAARVGRRVIPSLIY